ncbi:MAG TPA: hypothetical protein PLD84_14245, partial [Chitinophagales bacterium]|nr:hypothetical protein [Chitinophagales bacterium]
MVITIVLLAICWCGFDTQPPTFETIKTTFLICSLRGGQFAADSGGQFAANLTGQLAADLGGHYTRIF